MSTVLDRVGAAFGRRRPAGPAASVRVGADGPAGDIGVPRAGDGVWQVVEVRGRHLLEPDESSHYVYFVLPEAVLRRVRAGGGVWLEIEYEGDRFGQFRVHYVSRDGGAPFDGLYKPAEQRWIPDAVGLRRLRRALFPLPDFDPDRTQNHGAAFRIEFRQEARLARVSAWLEAPPDQGAFAAVAPVPELKKLPGRFYPINYLFIEITNACNFKCTWCPDEIMGRRRGFMSLSKAFRLLDEIAAKKSWLGPLYPIKLHQMGEPFLHPELVAIVERAEALGVGIELNTNCGLITLDRIEGLYRAGLTSLILSYQTPDPASFKTRKAPRMVFDDYRDKVRLAVERKVAMGARTHVEIDIMNTKHADGYSIVSEDEQALAFLHDWIEFCRGLEQRFALTPRRHDWDQIRSRDFLEQDENGSRYTLLDGVDLIWKRCHSWGNVIETGGDEAQATPASQAGPTAVSGALAGGGAETPIRDTYCPAPYDQFVIQWNGDVATCCTDYEGKTKVANVFAESVESIWTGQVLRQRKRDMLEGRLLDVCARCQGLP